MRLPPKVFSDFFDSGGKEACRYWICAYLVFVNFGTPLTNMSYASALQVSCLAKEWDTEHFARHFHS